MDVASGKGQQLAHGLEDAQKLVIIKGRSGFGNRILPAVAGLIYADLSGRRPVIDWRDGRYADPGVNAYPLLFQAPEPQQPDLWDGETDVRPPAWAGRLAMDGDTLTGGTVLWHRRNPFRYRKYAIRPDRPDPGARVTVMCNTLPKLAQLQAAWARADRTAPFAWNAQACMWLDRYFTPQPAVLTRVAAIAAALPRPCVGAHVRYTDRKVSLGRALAETGRLYRSTGARGVFLATDNAEVEAVFRRRFPDLVVAPKADWPPGLPRHRKQSGTLRRRLAEDALVDMWLLGEMDALIYSSHSTFSDMALLRLGSAPRTDIDRYSPRVALKRLLRRIA